MVPAYELLKWLAKLFIILGGGRGPVTFKNKILLGLQLSSAVSKLQIMQVW